MVNIGSRVFMKCSLSWREDNYDDGASLSACRKGSSVFPTRNGQHEMWVKFQPARGYCVRYSSKAVSLLADSRVRFVIAQSPLLNSTPRERWGRRGLKGVEGPGILRGGRGYDVTWPNFIYQLRHEAPPKFVSVFYRLWPHLSLL